MYFSFSFILLLLRATRRTFLNLFIFFFYLQTFFVGSRQQRALTHLEYEGRNEIHANHFLCIQTINFCFRFE